MLIQIKDLKECISKYKTVGAKKAFLTKEINALKEHYKEVKNAYEKRKKGSLYGWYLGERIFLINVRNAERNIKIVEKFKTENL
jgi:hypothetical protein